MEEEEKKEDICLLDEIEKKVDEKIKEFNATDINLNNLSALYQIIDIKKDLANIKYWDKKKEEIENEIRNV